MHMNDSESFQLDVFARRNLLFLDNQWMARRAARWARRPLPRNIEFDDLYQSASVGFLEAASRFDADFGPPFKAYAFPWTHLDESGRCEFRNVVPGRYRLIPLYGSTLGLYHDLQALREHARGYRDVDVLPGKTCTGVDFTRHL